MLTPSDLVDFTCLIGASLITSTGLIAPSKTKFMYVASKHNLNKINDDTPVMLNGQPIRRIHSISCLGVTLDETLSWEEHIEAICKKISAGMGMLKRITPFVPAQMLQPIYSALIQP